MQEISKILSLPEGKTLEFKRDLSSLQPILKTLVAFANTAGGTLIIGKDNEGNILGIEDVFAAEEKIANAIADSIYPVLLPEIEITSMQGKSLLVIRVVHWKGPFYLKSKGPIDGVFVRLGSTNRLAGAELLEELKRSYSKIGFDQQPCPEINQVDLDGQKLQSFSKSIGREIEENKLLTLGILVAHGAQNICSHGGIILFGQERVRLSHFPNTVVRCARFSGEEKIDFIDQLDIEKSIIDAIDEATKFIRRNTRLGAKIEGIQRQDIPEYSPIVIREVLINALVHADYSIRGMNTRVSIFSNRIEIESPGMLPFGYTLDDFMSGVSHVRNRVIAKVFCALHLMEEWGTGYHRIVQACAQSNSPIPRWEELSNAVRVSIYPSAITESKPPTMASLKIDEITPRQAKIMKLLQEKGKLRAKDIYEQLRSPISERTLRTDLQELKSKNMLITAGNGPSTYWTIA